MKKNDRNETTKEKIEVWETTSPLLSAMYNEIKALSLKKPDATLNPNKVKIINRLLIDIRELLENEPASKYLDLIDDEVLPQYSDVVIMLSQYSTAMGKFKERYHTEGDILKELGGSLIEGSWNTNN